MGEGGHTNLHSQRQYKSHTTSTTHLHSMVVGATDDVILLAEDGSVDCLGVSLEDVHRVDGRGPEVPQPEGGIQR